MKKYLRICAFFVETLWQHCTKSKEEEVKKSDQPRTAQAGLRRRFLSSGLVQAPIFALRPGSDADFRAQAGHRRRFLTSGRVYLQEVATYCRREYQQKPSPSKGHSPALEVISGQGNQTGDLWRSKLHFVKVWVKSVHCLRN